MRPSVALADYEISDTRTSAMSSLLLLFAILEGMCGFALPICSVFSKPAGPHGRYYYENFLFFQYGLSILALCYLQALIFYYDQKANYCQKYNRRFVQHQVRLDEVWPSHLKTAPEYLANNIDQNPGGLTLGYEVLPTAEQWDKPSTPETPEPSILQATLTDKPETSHRPSSKVQTTRYPRFAHSVPHLTFVLPEDSVTDTRESTRTNADHNTGEQDIHSVEHMPETSNAFPQQFECVGLETPAEYGRFCDENAIDGEKSQALEMEKQARSDNSITDDESTCGHLNTPEVPSNSEIPTVRNFRQKLSSVLPLQVLFGDDPQKRRPPGWYFSRDTEGVNLYLRLGAVGFGFGVMIFDGFKIAEPWEARLNDQESCHNHFWIPIHILHFIYVFWQTYFLFKHHQVVFNVQKFVLRFLLCHLAVANLCQWLKTVVDEISVEPHEATTSTLPLTLHQATHDLTNLSLPQTSSVSIVHTTMDPHMVTHSRSIGHGCRSTAKYLAPFLFPCAIEYSLIAGAMFYKMFQKVGHVRQESERLERIRQANNVSGHFAECHRSHKGLFIGLLLFMVTLVSMCLFFIFFTRLDKRNTAITLYQCTELVLLGLSMLTCVFTMIRLRVLHLSNLSEEGAFDDNLLLVGLVGMIFYDLFLLVPALEAIPSGKIAAKLFAAKALMEIAQSMVQVFFILEGSRRCAGSVAHVHNKPGRTLITFLLILNLAMWFVNTFEVKRADNHSIHIDYYTGMAWKIITHISLPMIVFFRFHSTVCLSDIWANAYRFRAS
ncbi:Proton channel OtopLc [Clonorchis sinensis]|uniref:Proton channel OtopLc n=2 Tax=Opisthorchiidae TaxID=6196 RepID=A0A8T1LXZ5_CLOSI|nr:Proton channel OtopLc [Clonorchis sinensis]